MNSDQSFHRFFSPPEWCKRSPLGLYWEAENEREMRNINTFNAEDFSH